MISEYTLKVIKLCHFLKIFSEKHSLYRMIELPSTLTITLYVYIRNEKFKGIIMSEYTSKLTILRHFLKTISMIHMPPKPTASAGCDTSIIFM